MPNRCVEDPGSHPAPDLTIGLLIDAPRRDAEWGSLVGIIGLAGGAAGRPKILLVKRSDCFAD